jgi:hypothetical protein
VERWEVDTRIRYGVQNRQLMEGLTVELMRGDVVRGLHEFVVKTPCQALVGLIHITPCGTASKM